MFPAAGFASAAVLPYPVLKRIGDSFASDGGFDRLTEGTETCFRIIFVVLFLFLTAVIIWGIWDQKGRKKFIGSALKFPSGCAADAVPFMRSFRWSVRSAPEWSLILLAGIVLCGAFLRILLLDRPLLHDEAYTMFIWGRSDLQYAVSDYHLPNNHLLNTFFVNLIYHLGARAAWMMRLPAFSCGVLLIFFVWVLGRAMYNDIAGVVSAALVAFCPFLVDYTVNARGYEIQALFTVMSAALALCIKRKNSPFAWFLLAVVSALNFFTIPTALYPFGGICLWLLIEGLSMEKGRKRVILRNIILMGITVGFFTVILYTPLLRYSGFKSLFGNIFVRPVDPEIFLPTLLARISESAGIFYGSIPLFASIVILIGIISSPSALKKYSGCRISFAAAMFLWLLIVIPVQRPNLWPRTLLYLYPILLLSAASGLSLFAGNGTLRHVSAFCIMAAVAVSAAPQFLSAAKSFGSAGTTERAVWKILAEEGNNAGNVYVATVSEDNAPLWVYADFYGPPEKIFDRSQPFDAVYVFVNSSNKSEDGANTLEGVLLEEGPGMQFIDESSVEILLNSSNGILYRYDAKTDTVAREYAKHPPILR